MQMSLFWRATVTTLCLFFFVGPGALARHSNMGRLCPSGSFKNAETGECRVCTHPCPRPLVEISSCRHDADTQCGTPKAGAVVTRSAKVCAADAFLNKETGRCQGCTRFCRPPLVMTSPCLQDSDATCGLPRPRITRPDRKGDKSRRRKGSRERKRRRKGRKRAKDRTSHQKTSLPETSAQLCIGDGSQFYDLERGRCLPCRSCDAPGYEEHLPCTSTSDRVCRPTRHGAHGSTVNPSESWVQGSNELPQDGTKPESMNRSHNNEYPGLRVEVDGGLSTGEAGGTQGQSQANSNSVRSNISE